MAARAYALKKGDDYSCRKKLRFGHLSLGASQFLMLNHSFKIYYIVVTVTGRMPR